MNDTNEQGTATALSGGAEISAEVLSTLAEIGEEVNASLDLDEVLARTAALIKRHIDYEIFGVLMSEGGRETGAILEVEELLRRAAEQTKRVIDYQILSIMLYDEEQKVFRHRVDVKHGQRVQGKMRAAASEGIVGAAATLKEPVIVPDVTVDSRYLMVNPETRSELAIPMIHKGKVIGVLDLESPQPNYFTEDHVQTLSILAANFAVSLENARLYEQVARDEARLERDLQAAKRIQGALLRPVPTEDFGVDLAARYLSAREVCGDLYEFLRYGPHQLGIALGDVSGKGTAAALYGAVSIGIMRSLAPQKLQPAEMLMETAPYNAAAVPL